MTVRILVGDCLVRLKELPDASIDSVVTDPPYHLTSIVKRFGAASAAPAQVGKTGAYARASAGFMGQKWDGGDIAFRVDTWAEIMRVLKPGGHLVAFSGTRTYHRMVVAIEDAGFEIRDQLAWLYGSGFPKSHDVSKGIDKAKGEKGSLGGPKSAAHAGWIERGAMRGAGGHEGLQRPWMDDAEAVDRNARSYIPGTPEAAQWQGWGTALKPAHEPICLARKPLGEKTVAANVLAHGAGALNIDGCRIGTGGGTRKGASDDKSATSSVGGYLNAQAGELIDGLGRYPANIIHDGSDDVLAGFPSTAPAKSGKPRSGANGDGWGMTATGAEYDDDGGSAARFFYSAKATSEERSRGLDDRSPHPTVKPVALMQWLVKLITPPGGTVLDPFLGSGSTAVACQALGFDVVGCELSPEYAEIAAKRCRGDLPMMADVEVSPVPTEQP